MTRINRTEGNVIYADFTPRPLVKHHGTKRKPSGVFIKPSMSDVSIWAIGGNLSGAIASYIAFHPEFSPDLFGAQVRREMGVIMGNDDLPPSAA